MLKQTAPPHKKKTTNSSQKKTTNSCNIAGLKIEAIPKRRCSSSNCIEFFMASQRTPPQKLGFHKALLRESKG